jgi:hypothetical protein
MAVLIQWFSTRIFIMHDMGVYDVKSAMMFGIVLSFANAAAVTME